MQKSMIITNAMLLPRQAAARIGVTAGTLSIWRCTGRYDLPYVKAGAGPSHPLRFSPKLGGGKLSSRAWRRLLTGPKTTKPVPS